MVHRSTAESSPGVADAVTGFTGVDELGAVDEVVALADVVALGEVVALRWSEGLLPSDASAAPHAALVSSAATAPAPKAYRLHVPGRLWFS
jgi:hypothetical protein